MARPDAVIEIRHPSEGAVVIHERVTDLPAVLKKVTVTDDGKLQFTLETQGIGDETLANIKNMLVLQQAGPIYLEMTPAQRDLFNA